MYYWTNKDIYKYNFVHCSENMYIVYNIKSSVINFQHLHQPVSKTQDFNHSSTTLTI